MYIKDLAYMDKDSKTLPKVFAFISASDKNVKWNPLIFTLSF